MMTSQLKFTLSTIAVSTLWAWTSARAQGCVQMDWSAPATIGTPTAYGAYVEIPEILESKEGIMFIGSPSWTYEKDPTKFGPVAGFLRSNDGTFTVIPLPPGHKRLAAPRATFGPDGTLHLLWVPPDSTGYEDRSDRSRLFSSRFVRGAWTTPVTVFRDGKALYWTYNSTTGVVSRGPDREIVAPFLETRSIAIVQLKDTVWHFSVLLSGTPTVSKPRLVLPQKGVVLIGFIDLDRETDSKSRGLYGLFIRRSLDDGTSWTAPIRISRPESEYAFDPFVLSAADGHLVATWTVGNRIGKRSAIAVSVSSDTGRTWTLPSVTPIGRGTIESLRAALARDGSLWVVVQNVIGKSRSPAVFAWDGRWSRIWSPPNETQSFGQPTIGAVKDQIVVTWATSAAKVQGQTLDMTRYVLGHPRC
jgi:hypothetical protein